MKLVRRIVRGTTLLAFFAGTANASPQLYQHLLDSTGWIVVPRERNSTTGTCWIVDAQSRLVVTAAHVVLDSPEVLVYFPRTSKGQVIAESGRYLREFDARLGRVVHTDTDRDLALVQLVQAPEKIPPLPLAPQSARPGETVHSIGNSGAARHLTEGILWRYTRGAVRQLFEQKAGPRGSRNVCMIETQSPINDGDSGGAVVNDDGAVIGVVSFFKSDEQLVSYHVDVRELKLFLAQAAKKTAATENTRLPPEHDRLLGTWTFHSHSNGNLAASGTSVFRRDGVYVLEPEGEPDNEDPPQRGRYTFANGILWLISDDGIASLPVSWTNPNHFRSRAQTIEFQFERRPPRK